MPFKDIACHVWAIDGYKDDKTAELVNALFAQAACKVLKPNNQDKRNAIVKQLVDMARQSQVTTQKIIVYGGFRSRANAPEHMWIQHDGMIYETMPGYRLYSEKATAGACMCPQLENEKFPEGCVGQYATFLTENQRDYLANPTAADDPNIGM